jgi:phosphopantetheinyl transferase
MPEGRRLEWLLARVAAKDAVRRYVRDRSGLVLNPADVEIHADGNGRPFVAGAWTSEIADVPLISLAHSQGTAVAVAVSGTVAMGVGVDVEPVGRMSSAVEQLAFAPAELALLADLPDTQAEHWPLRLWCAKEAVAKAFGNGMTNGPRSLSVTSVDIATETAWLIPSAPPRTSGSRSPLPAFTARDGDLIVAASLYGR